MIASSSWAKAASVLAASAVMAGLMMGLPPAGNGAGGAEHPGADRAGIEIAASFADLAGPELTASAPVETLMPAEAAPLAAIEAEPLAAQQAQPLASATPAPAPRAVATDRVSANMMRPAPRSAAVQRAHQARAANRAAAQPSPRPSRATSTNRANSGGATTSTTRAPRTNTAAQRAARAAIQAYPGQVQRCVSRAGRARARGSGTARVRFSITSNGRISGVRLAQSSGNRSVDRAALTQIRRAGPCPAPPPGARREFGISVRVN